MTEKIKINVTKETADILIKDAESFEFYKKDGRSLNKNALYTRIIVNYHETYRAKEAELFSYLKKALSKCKASKQETEELCYEVAAHINKLNAAKRREKFDCALSVKPTKESEPIIAYTEEYLLKGATLSEYFRNMFSSYASLPQDEREKIVFMPQYETIMQAIERKKKIFVTTSSVNGQKKYELSPYALSDSKEELHVYLLSCNNCVCMPMRLSRIESVSVLTENAVFTPQQKETFEKMLTFGPQFPYGKNEGEVKIQLSRRGIMLFKKMYVHRPVPVRVSNNEYYFQCSHNQIIQYFVRFGKNAYVVYPQSVRDSIRSFYAEAIARYDKGIGYFSKFKETDHQEDN